MNIKLEIFLFGLLGVFLLLEIVWAIRTESRLKKFFSGKKGKNLEENIFQLEQNLAELQTEKEKMEKEISEIKQKLRKSIRGLETIRFNPFPDQGSNQSFAISMLNEDGDGVVLSSLYSRERMSVFAKPVKDNKSEYELTKEEKEALKKARV